MRALKLDVAIRLSGDLRHDAERIERAEQLGFDAVWVSETAHNPFFPLSVSAKATQRIRLGTRNAAAFPRSPMVTAQIAWALARQTGGRFSLGLDTLEQTHIERRFSENWSDPIGRIREYIESLRAIWDSFQTDARLRYRGKHYRFRLMAPFFNPGPVEHPQVAVFLAGADADVCQLAGEICQGLHAHEIHTASSLREIVAPAVETGLNIADRARSDFEVTAPVFVLTQDSASERNRAASAIGKRLAAYSSSPAYRRVMSLHGWGALADDIQEIARLKRWADMHDAITDDALEAFLIIAKPGDIYAAVVDRYAGIADRVCLEWREDSLELFDAIAASRA